MKKNYPSRQKETSIHKKLLRLSIVIILFSTTAVFAQNTYYVDTNNVSCGDNNDGSEANPWCSIRKANTTLVSGDIVYIKKGNYVDDGIRPSNSGSSGQDIIYKNWEDDLVTISKGASNLDAINLVGKSYIVVDGIEVTSCRKYIIAENSHHNIIKNCDFSGGTSFTVGQFWNNCTYNKILDNFFKDGGDHISIVDNSDYNLVEGNNFGNASHANFAVKCSNFNIIRGNYFYNNTQKIGEVYDCDNTSNYNATKYNLIENNRFAFTPSSGNASPYAGIQYVGQNGIIRKNSFYNNIGGGLRLALYGTEGRFNTENRIYNNVFYKNRHSGAYSDPISSRTLNDNIFKNNIFYQNFFEANDTRWSWWVNELDGNKVQIKLSQTDGVYFDTNNLFNAVPNDNEVIAYGNRDPLLSPSFNTLAWSESNYPTTFSNNIEAEPQFVDAINYDFHLKETSPMIDAGTFLTKTSNSGAGTSMSVDDAGYFYDGFGISGEAGDVIQLEGQSQKAVITSIDYINNILTLDTALTWTVDTGIGLEYNSNKPDMGAFEYSAALSLNEKDYDINTISLYPNPTSDLVIIDLKDTYLNVSFKIFDISGKKLFENYLNNTNKAVFNANQLNNGLYFVTIKTDNKINCLKFIKK